MTEIVKFRPEEIDEAIEGLDGLRDIIAPVLRRINGDGMGEQDAQQFIRQLTLAKHALIAMGGFLETEMKMVQALSNDPLSEEQLREMDEEWVWIELLAPLYGMKSGYFIKRFRFSDEKKFACGYPDVVVRWLSYAGYMDTWRAYRRKPEEVP